MIGVHVSKTEPCWNVPDGTEAKKARGSMLEALKYDLNELNMHVAQIFTHGPRSYASSHMNYKEIHDYCKSERITLIVHASYMTPRVWEHAETEYHLRAQMSACSALGAYGLVVHLPKLGPDAIADRLHKFAAFDGHARLLLEIEPRKDNKDGYATPDRINELCASIKKSGNIPDSSWGICLDTAHIWASGIDISTAENMRSWLRGLKYPQKVSLVHFNGCATARGYARDTHAIPWDSQDALFGDKSAARSMTPEKAKNTGAYVMYKWCEAHSVPMVMEINMGNREGLEQCTKILRSFQGR